MKHSHTQMDKNIHIYIYIYIYIIYIYIYIYTHTHNAKIMSKNNYKYILNHTTTQKKPSRHTLAHRGKITVSEIQNHSNTYTHTNMYRKKRVKYRRQMRCKAGVNTLRKTEE